MVSTRRMESSGSAVDTVPHLTRVVNEARENSELCSSSDTEEPSQEEESWSEAKQHKQRQRQRHSLPTYSGRVRELRNRFVCSDLAFSSKRVRGQVVRRNCQSLDRRGRVYSTHEMPDDSDDFLMDRDESADEIFSPRKDLPSRHERHSKLRRLKRSSGKMDRSLRPLKQTSYVDHSSMTHSNSSGDDKPETDLRRSTRQRTLKYDTFNTSWITDAQMVRGYPNLKMDFLSDQDSRHSQENDHQTRYNSLRSRSTRKEANHDSTTRYNGDASNKREIKKNIKYLYDYDTSEVRPRRMSVRGQTDVQDTPDDSNEQTEKEPVNKNGTDEEIPRKLNRRTRNKEMNDTAEHEHEHEHVNGVKEKETVNGADTSENKQSDIKKEDEKDQSCYDLRENRNNKGHNETKDGDIDTESDNAIRPQRKRRRQQQQSNLNYMEDPRYSPRKTRNRKISDSEKSSDSSEDEDIRNQRYKYQLRQRKPPKKPDQISSLQVPVRRSDRLLHSLCSRSRRDRRRSSTSDDSSSNEEPTRSRKLNKTKHSRHPTSNSSNPECQLKSGPVGNVPAPIGPETLDTKVRFASVGGLDNHVRCLREMVVLPMMYPEIFRQFQIQPPRGVLFHGPPGTGKTLLARALANECSFGSRKVSFFMRKGADLLSKWVGESEKQLRLLFEQAAQMKPSIIFFDELDGLAPVRSSRQDQIHASIVSTLLALMDGLDSRGEVIVIGATNRIDAIDPALRRPGRFDRELYFPLPARKEREEILRVHVAQWNLPPNEALISHLAEQSAGYCGSDLRALCSEAVIQGLRRTYPQVYTTDYRLQLDPTQVKVEKVDFLRARSLLIPASHRVTQGLGRKLPVVLEPVLKTALDTVLNLLKESFPHGLDPALASVKVSNSMQTAQLLLTADSHAQGQSVYLAPALLYYMEHVNTYTLDLSTLYKESARSAEEACVEVFNEARRNVPSVIYVPNMEQWWSLVAETVRAIFLSQLSSLDPNIPILFLATANCPYAELPEDINTIFSPYRKEVLHLSAPVAAQREAFFRPLIITAAMKPPKMPKLRPKTPPPLPRAPTPPPEPLSETELKKMYDKEEETLRELRIFLRDMCKKLASNKMFYMFTKPVDLEEVPDYLTIIKQPMDLETMMTKVDLHRYSSAQEFLADIDLICMNALEYNPAKTSADKQIRHRACSLRDYAYALIKAEMDSDFEGQCRDISKKRKDRKASVTQFLPPFIHTKPSEVLDDDENELTKDSMDGDVLNKTNECAALKTVDSRTNSARISPSRKRKVPPWARGYLKNNKRKRTNRSVLSESHHQDESQAMKSSSGDESKENKPDTKTSVCILDDSTLEIEQSIERERDIHTALTETANCDIDSQKHKTNTVEKKAFNNETLSPAIWPSYAHLIEDTPHVDVDDLDLDDSFTQSDEQIKVKIDEKELNVALEKAVSATRGCSILSLMDLYGQLSRVVNIYLRTCERKTLPQELLKEITRFQDIQNLSTSSTNNMAAS